MNKVYWVVGCSFPDGSVMFFRKFNRNCAVLEGNDDLVIDFTDHVRDASWFSSGLIADDQRVKIKNHPEFNPIQNQTLSVFVLTLEEVK